VYPKRFVAGGALLSALLLGLTACSSAEPVAREEALSDARSVIDKVSALAVESAIGLTLDDYSQAVSRGEAWPKPTFATVGDDTGERLPSWAGASFDVSTDDSGSYPVVLVSYAVSGQGSAGSGFNSRVSRVLLCVTIGVEFIRDEVDVYVDPPVREVTCPDDVLDYYGASDLITLAELGD
jgi:hypothetical protein